MARGEIQIRKATPQDYKDVMNIDTNAYYGNDILRYHFQDYLDDTNRICHVATFHNKVIGLQMLHLTDSKSRVTAQHSRMAHDFRAKGILSNITGANSSYFQIKSLMQLKNEIPVLPNRFSGTISSSNLASTLMKLYQFTSKRAVVYGSGSRQKFCKKLKLKENKKKIHRYRRSYSSREYH